jgi:tetratricopeptide (TPR) repeat protein
MKAAQRGWSDRLRLVVVAAAICLCSGAALSMQYAAQIRKLDSEQDRLEHCLNYPDPPNVHWQRSVVAALCHHTFDSLVTLDQIADMLKKHHSDEVNSIFASYRQAQRSGKQPDVLDVAFDRTFSDACKCARDAADAWLAASPHSAYALAASGIQYAMAAGVARGTKYANETPPENFARMHVLDAKADADLRKALSIDPGLMPAISQEAILAMREGRRNEALMWLSKGLQRDPENFHLNDIIAMNAMPRWGGSVPELNQAKARALRNADRNPMLVLVASEVDVYLQECDDCTMTMRDFESTMMDAPILSSLRQAGVRAVEGHNFPVGVIYLSELLRFSPTSELWARTNRGIAWTFIGDFDAAQHDADIALALRPDYQPALQLSRMIAASRAEASELAKEAHQHTQ